MSETNIIQSMLRRGVVAGTDPDPMMQTIQSEDLEVRECEHFEPFGLTAHPPDGAETIVARIGGTGHPVCLAASDRRYRPTGGAVGETRLYDANGTILRLHSGGAALNDDLDVDGDVIASGDYRRGVATGVSGTLTATLIAPNVGVLTMVVSGGIVTSVAGTGVFVWAPIP